mgnify:CR=1 FL=1
MPDGGGENEAALRRQLRACMATVAALVEELRAAREHQDALRRNVALLTAFVRGEACR